MCIHGYSLATHDNSQDPFQRKNQHPSALTPPLENATMETTHFTCFKTDRQEWLTFLTGILCTRHCCEQLNILSHIVLRVIL